MTYFLNSDMEAQRGLMVKNLPAVQESWVWSLGQEDPLEKKMATHFSILAWRIPWTEEPGRLPSIGSQRVRYSGATHFHFPRSYTRYRRKADLNTGYLTLQCVSSRICCSGSLKRQRTELGTDAGSLLSLQPCLLPSQDFTSVGKQLNQQSSAFPNLET